MAAVCRYEGAAEAVMEEVRMVLSRLLFDDMVLTVIISITFLCQIAITACLLSIVVVRFYSDIISLNHSCIYVDMYLYIQGLFACFAAGVRP